ncbi:hypothetical protein SUGI_0252110 [Cryptomeria japonica]|nr:hypothetical protein SUGI_0252110 [Cryptomeria japonica]
MSNAKEAELEDIRKITAKRSDVSSASSIDNGTRRGHPLSFLRSKEPNLNPLKKLHRLTGDVPIKARIFKKKNGTKSTEIQFPCICDRSAASVVVTNGSAVCKTRVHFAKVTVQKCFPVGVQHFKREKHQRSLA